jgi:uncharacterized protein YuzE
MKITYDHEVDALYIRFKETTVTTKHIAEDIAADYDADGYLAGIEILNTLQRLGDPTVFKQIILEERALRRFS